MQMAYFWDQIPPLNRSECHVSLRNWLDGELWTFFAYVLLKAKHLKLTLDEFHRKFQQEFPYYRLGPDLYHRCGVRNFRKLVCAYPGIFVVREQDQVYLKLRLDECNQWFGVKIFMIDEWLQGRHVTF